MLLQLPSLRMPFPRRPSPYLHPHPLHLPQFQRPNPRHPCPPRQRHRDQSPLLPPSHHVGSMDSAGLLDPLPIIKHQTPHHVASRSLPPRALLSLEAAARRRGDGSGILDGPNGLFSRDVCEGRWYVPFPRTTSSQTCNLPAHPRYPEVTYNGRY